MKGFSTALDSALREIRWNRSDLARAAQRSTSTVAEWFGPTYRPALKLIEELHALLPQPQFVQVLLAHLNDEIPPAARNLVLLAARDDGRIREEDIDILKGLPVENRELARWVGRETLTNEPLRKSIEATRELLGHGRLDR